MHFEIIENEPILGAQECWTFHEATTYFRSEESGGIEDSLIIDLMTGARETIEKMTNLSLIDRNIKVHCVNWAGYLPYGPVVEIQSVQEIKKTGTSYPYIDAKEQDLIINYKTKAFKSIALKNAILELALFWYERGDFTMGSFPEKLNKVILNNRRIFGI